MSERILCFAEHFVHIYQSTMPIFYEILAFFICKALSFMFIIGILWLFSIPDMKQMDECIVFLAFNISTFAYAVCKYFRTVDGRATML